MGRKDIVEVLGHTYVLKDGMLECTDYWEADTMGLEAMLPSGVTLGLVDAKPDKESPYGKEGLYFPKYYLDGNEKPDKLIFGLTSVTGTLEVPYES